MKYKQNIKIYQIDTTFYEFVNKKTSKQIILHIINSHRYKIKKEKFENLDIASTIIDNVTYYMYRYDESERQSIWKNYLPNKITENQNFDTKKVSFVIFAVHKIDIFVIIGGGGIFVIQRFINHTFGIDLYERIAEPSIDIVNTIKTRNIAGNLTSKEETYKNKQNLIDSLFFGQIPNKINLVLRKDIINTIFGFIDFGKEKNISIEIGTAFNLKWKVTFDEIHQIIIKFGELINSRVKNSLSRFEKIRDKSLIENEINPILYEAIRNDMTKIFMSGANPYTQKLDIDFVHPSKILAYFECDSYMLFVKNKQNCFYETPDRNSLYKEGLRYLFKETKPDDYREFNRIILGMRVKGYKKDQKVTEAMFIQHLTCEINFRKKRLFYIDTKWYSVKGDFIKTVNDKCTAMIKANYFDNHPLKKEWNATETEGIYNQKYTIEDHFIVLDKILGQNIEMCDLFYEHQDTIYLIHVKKGFDAKIRDLSNQITISARRLNNDISSKKYEFVDAVIKRYNNQKNIKKISIEKFRAKFEKKIIYVMAFCSSNSKKIIGNIDNIKSNIAKFSVIQCVQLEFSTE